MLTKSYSKAADNEENDDGNGTFKRYKKDSFNWYKKVIEATGEDLAVSFNFGNSCPNK